jgi:hypothetical protein
MNEVVAELEIVKKKQIMIQKTVQWTVSSLCKKEVEISQNGNYIKLSTKYYELERNTIY